MPLHLIHSEKPEVESSKYENIDNEDKWFDACSNESEIEEITEEIIQKPHNNKIKITHSIPSPISFENSTTLKNEAIYPIKESNYLYGRSIIKYFISSY